MTRSTPERRASSQKYVRLNISFFIPSETSAAAAASKTSCIIDTELQLSFETLLLSLYLETVRLNIQKLTTRLFLAHNEETLPNKFYLINPVSRMTERQHRFAVINHRHVFM